jgi:hypothetical protein
MSPEMAFARASSFALLASVGDTGAKVVDDMYVEEAFSKADRGSVGLA